MIRPKPVLRRMTYADHHAKPPDPEPGGQLEVPTVGANSHAQLMARPSGLPLASEPIIGDIVRPAGDVMQKCDARNASTEGVGIELYEPNEFDNGMEDHAEDLFGDFGGANNGMDIGLADIVPPIMRPEQMPSRKSVIATARSHAWCLKCKLRHCDCLFGNVALSGTCAKLRTACNNAWW